MLRMYSRFKPQYNYKEIISALFPSSRVVKKYEDQFAQKFQRPYAVMFNYGRSALYSLFKVWNLQNAEIICPAYTCVVVPHAIVLSQNIPVFVDSQDDHFNMSLEGIRNAITPKTRAIIVTHIFGYPVDVESVERIVSQAEQKFKHKIYIIQDCAHSFGTQWNNKSVTQFGDASIFGLNISKTINSIFGGMAITSDQETYNRLLQYRQENFYKPPIGKGFRYFLYLIGSHIAFNSFIYSIVYKMEKNGWLNRFTKYYDEGKIDFPSDWDQLPCPIQARIGIVQLSKYDHIIRQRVQFARRLPSLVSHLKGVKLPPFYEGATYSHFVGIVENPHVWCTQFEKIGIQLGRIIDYSVPEMKAYKNYRRGNYPNALHYSKSLINFPLFTKLSNKKLTHLKKTLPSETLDETNSNPEV